MTNTSHSRRLCEHQRTVIGRVQSAAAACLGLELREAQIIAATHLQGPCIAEMQTGEGKTLTAVLAAAVFATANRKVLIATANDYLASRDADWMGPIYQRLGLGVGCVTSESTPQQRVDAYDCDITYGTLREFAFDFLRRSLAARQADSQVVMDHATFNVLIVDEADSVLIDEARTPMIITAPTRGIDVATEACYRWSAEQAKFYRLSEDYVRMTDSGAVALTVRGHGRFVRSEMPPAMGALTTTDILHSLERAIWINESIHRDHHYVIKDERIHIIDEYTGRKSGERHFGGGIHQAIEAREGLMLTAESEPVARISVQDFVMKFKHLCGITATAREDRQELQSVYGLSVRTVDTHHKSQRTILDTIVCGSREQKWERIADETRAVIKARRAVLIGTRSVAQSEQLSKLFRACAIDHAVLNARNPKLEAGIIAAAGRMGRVTIATNMAGRGTDIRLDSDVAAAGGLHVIVSEPHAAARIDRQLIGRSARQADPGTARAYVCPDDEILLQAFGDERAKQICNAWQQGVSDRWLLKRIMRAQQRVSRNHRLERARLTAHQTSLAEALQQLGLDPYLDPLPNVR